METRGQRTRAERAQPLPTSSQRPISRKHIEALLIAGVKPKSIGLMFGPVAKSRAKEIRETHRGQVYELGLAILAADED